MEYYEPLADGSASYSDFEPMPFDEDSGYAEDMPVDIRSSHSPASEPIHDRAITEHLREGVVFDSPYFLAPSQQHAYLDNLETNRRPTSTSEFARSSELSGQYVPGFEGRRNLDLPSSLRPARYSENSVDVRKEPSFLERMTAKYPYLSASISSGVSSPRTASSGMHYGNAPRLLSPFVELDLPDFISDIASKPNGPTEAADEVAVTTLLDAVEGRLFEGSNPWKVIRGRLSCSPSGLVVSASAPSPTDDGFHELQNATDRRGVGFREPCPIHPPPNPYEDRIMQGTLASSDDPPSHASHDSRSNAPTSLRSLLDLSPLTSMSSSELRVPLHEDSKSLNTPQLLAMSADHFFITPNVDSHHQSPHDTLGSTGASPPIAAKSSSPARRLAESHALCISPIRKEPASLQELPSIKRSPLIVHSSPRIACTAPSSVSASAGLPENTSAGDVEEGQRARRQEDREDSNSIVPIQSTPKETFVAGPLLFDDELEDGDDVM
ncbi:hypothetical protein BC629DRAFT_1158797 [Irpex lacteus]|nr:hypothetical protein BC629DRAFT_1158797 [Irpex lacteus]